MEKEKKGMKKKLEKTHNFMFFFCDGILYEYTRRNLESFGMRISAGGEEKKRNFVLLREDLGG